MFEIRVSTSDKTLKFDSILGTDLQVMMAFCFVFRWGPPPRSWFCANTRRTQQSFFALRMRPNGFRWFRLWRPPVCTQKESMKVFFEEQFRLGFLPAVLKTIIYFYYSVSCERAFVTLQGGRAFVTPSMHWQRAVCSLSLSSFHFQVLPVSSDHASVPQYGL